MVNEVCAEPRVAASVALTDNSDGAPMTHDRPSNRETETEDQRTPAREGTPPRPATEPKGSEGSSNSGETATDPATGKPNP
jgi:hypothetical protein